MFGDSEGFLCVYVGRISNEKRMDVLIDAARDLAAQAAGGRRTYIALIGGEGGGIWGRGVLVFQTSAAQLS